MHTRSIGSRAYDWITDRAYVFVAVIIAISWSAIIVGALAFSAILWSVTA